MKLLNIFFIFILKILIFSSSYLFGSYIITLKAKVSDYNVVSYYFEDYNKNLFLIIREFKLNNNPFVLAVNCFTYETSLLCKNYTFKHIRFPIFLLKNCSFEKIFFLPPLQNGKNKQDIYLTVDLCPSSKMGFDEFFFTSLINYGKAHHKTINIAIAITATWAQKHFNEFIKLKKWHENKDLNITWVNHSYTHYFSCKLPINNNFMLHKKNDTYNEIINNEIYMIENGIVPSIFFRFPGLVYNDLLLQEVQRFHLITLDCNAWLAKTKGSFSPGSIILLHGNKNERIGIDIFLNLLQQGAFNEFNFAPLTNILRN